MGRGLLVVALRIVVLAATSRSPAVGGLLAAESGRCTAVLLNLLQLLLVVACTCL